jgi:alkylation response protein AidB-like acyl-CoA dehydrogenase
MFSPPPLAPDQLETVELAAAVSRECLAPRAARYDAEASFPFESYRDLHQAGLLALNVPKEYGGLGADPLTYAACLLELAKGCPATALTFNMHSTDVLFVTALGNEEQRRRYLGEVVREGKLLASITSEPGSTYRAKYVIRTIFRPAEAGYQVSGIKYFCSLADGADYFVTSGMLEGTESAQDGLITALIPRAQPGVTVIDKWNATGMRGTTSHTIKFDTFVPREAVLGEPGGFLNADLTRFALGYAAVYLGIGQAAFEYILDQIKSKSLKAEGGPADNPLVQQSIAEMAIRIRASRQLLWEAALSRLNGDREASTLAVNQAKYFGSEVGIWVTEQCIRLAGGRGILKDQPLERWHRDSLAGPVMPPANERVLETVGKALLGIKAAAIEFR